MKGMCGGNKAITGWLYGGDVTYGAAPARWEGSLSPAGRLFYSTSFTVAVISPKGQEEKGEPVTILMCDREFLSVRTLTSH